MGQTERLPEHEHRDQELQRRADILHHADGGELQPLGSEREQDQREGRDRPGGHQQRNVPAALPHPATARLVGEPDEPQERERREQGNLDEEPRAAVDGNLFPDHAVTGKRGAQRQRDPGHMAEGKRHHRHADRRNHHGDPLRRAQRLRKDQHADQHIDQRVDIIAERGLHRAAGIHRPDIDRPVRPDQHARDRQPFQVRAREGRLHVAPVGGQRDQQDRRRHRPDDPVRQKFERADMLHRADVQRQAAPDEVSQQGSGKSKAEGGVHARDL